VFIRVYLWLHCLALSAIAQSLSENIESQMSTNKDVANDLSNRIIGCALLVSNKLGAGFLEKVYENALAYELRKAGLTVQQQHNVAVHYDGVVVGVYTADLLVENVVLVELKAVQALDAFHKAQCMNYLKATGLLLCLLLNFGRSRLEIKRLING
jgi:GxxExxY protein